MAYGGSGRDVNHRSALNRNRRFASYAPRTPYEVTSTLLTIAILVSLGRMNPPFNLLHRDVPPHPSPNLIPWAGGYVTEVTYSVLT